MKSVSDKSCRENQNTHFVSSRPPLLPENRTVYEIIRKNVAEPMSPQMTIYGACAFAFWSTKVTNPHSEYAIRTAVFKGNTDCRNASSYYAIIRCHSFLLLVYLKAPWEGRIITVDILARTWFRPNLRYCCGKWRKGWGKARITWVRMANLFMVRGWCRTRNTNLFEPKMKNVVLHRAPIFGIRIFIEIRKIISEVKLL
jgi:hypothetical protein